MTTEGKDTRPIILLADDYDIIRQQMVKLFEGEFPDYRVVSVEGFLDLAKAFPMTPQ